MPLLRTSYPDYRVINDGGEIMALGFFLLEKGGGKIQELLLGQKHCMFCLEIKQDIKNKSNKLVTDLQDGWGYGRFLSVGGGGLLLMADLKGHNCACSLIFFKIVNYQNSGLGMKTK